MKEAESKPVEIELFSLEIENFKGIRKFVLVPDGKNVAIEAENGVGKTSIADAFSWVTKGKNSEGKTDSGKGRFEIRPLDTDNNVIPGLDVCVTLGLRINGNIHYLKKLSKEKKVKGEVTGYTTLCWIDEVSKSITEFNAYLDDFVPEEVFKMLTDLMYFNRIHWAKRRDFVVSIAGDVPKPENFDFIANLNGRTVDEYKSVFENRKKDFEKKRESVKPKIAENQRKIDELGDCGDVSIFGKQRDNIKDAIEKLIDKRKAISQGEKERLLKLENIEAMRRKLAEREIELVKDTSGIVSLLKEKSQFEVDLSVHDRASAAAESKAGQAVKLLENAELTKDEYLVELDKARSAFLALEKIDVTTTCYACKQVLPTDQIESIKAKRAAELESLKEHCIDIKNSIATIEQTITTLRSALESANEQLKTTLTDRDEFKKFKEKRTAEIDDLIRNRKTKPASEDDVYKAIALEIQKAEKELGKSQIEQFEELETRINDLQFDLDNVNDKLKKFDNIKDTKVRIQELKEEEAKLSQFITDTDKELDQIEKYNLAYNKNIETAVNAMFECVQFNLFDYKLNGNVDICCNATYKGVPYEDLSTGQQIYVGMDIINVLSRYYRCLLPIFIDHAESVTLPLKTKAQTIKLYAKKGVKELTVA